MDNQSTYTLYGSRRSGSAAIEVALRRCKLRYRVERASSWESDSALETLARLNPLLQIPTLVLPDGGVMTESAAILIHLDSVVPAAGLLPVAPGPRSQAIRGLVFIAANCYSAVSIADYPERWTLSTTQQARDNVRQAACRQLHRSWEVFADTFPADPYLSGAELGALDILATVVSKWSGARAHLEKHRPEFVRLIHRVEAHDTVAPVFHEHWRG